MLISENEVVAAFQTELMENTLSFGRQKPVQTNIISSKYYNAEVFLHMHTKRMNNVKVAGIFMLFHFHEHKQLLRYLKLSEAHF